MSFGVARIMAAGAFALLCAGCTVFTAGERAPSATPFDILGRVLASNDGRAFSANFRWRYTVAESEIWLMSPAGQTLAHIAADAAGATLTTADQQEYRALSVENLTRRALGWPLPLAQLQHWIHGEVIPGGAIAAVARDAKGRLSLLEQEGWSIRYAYPEPADGTPLPRRLDMLQAGQRLLMVIDEWRQQSPP
ncbi:MAG: lipoprotein insertase outer membrane protein LolB [Burkholderiales bacterium]|nr:lipoprotein insertase outer membrane protein LolB [Burkholderiales bacterium]